LVGRDLRAAEEELGRGRIAHRSPAALVAERKERTALSTRDLRVEPRILDVALALMGPGRWSRPARGDGAPAGGLWAGPGGECFAARAAVRARRRKATGGQCRDDGSSRSPRSR